MGCLARALRNGFWIASCAFAVAFMHGVRAGFCDLANGTALFVLGPGIGTLLGGVWGVVAAELARRWVRPSWRRGIAGVALAIAGPLGSALLQLAFFYRTPMVFAFDPFVGYFSGALYDTVLHDTGLWSYRAASLASLFAIYVLSVHLQRDGRDHLVLHRPPRRGLALLGGLAALASAVSVAFGPSLGHWQTAGTIADALGGEVTFGRCRVIHDGGIEASRAELFARDCDGHVEAIANWLAISIDEPVTVFLFADADQKRRLMGASRTSVAKPWRREIYVQDKGYPHDVLGHELVHALAGAIGRGPFDIAGSVGGLLPNPGLIEGLAVAAEPNDDDLTSAEWAAAMRRIEVLPGLSELFGLGFFGEASSTSYTAAGAFVGWVRERFGIDTVKRWHGGDSLPALTGMGWGELERAWWSDLDGLALSDAALATARARFDRPGVLARRCPHEIDEHLHDAASRDERGDVGGALTGYRAALDLDPNNVSALFGVASCFDRLAQPEQARAELEGVAASDAQPQTVKSNAYERMGDLELRAGHAAEARRLYRLASDGVTNEDRLRTIDMKSHYADQPLGRAALLALLIGTTPRGPDEVEALDRIGAWRAAADGDGTPEYLLARQHLARNNYALAAERLDSAFERGLPVERAVIESIRMRLVTACALGDADTARRMLARYVAAPLVAKGRARLAEALVVRCTR
jgi:hypothetical protein